MSEIADFGLRNEKLIMPEDKRKRPRVWPGMPSVQSQMLETVVSMFPAILVILVITTLTLLSFFRGCVAG